MIDTVSSTTTTTSSTTSTKGPAAGSQDYFLKLLVAQMKNQDPLNPLDNAQVTSQMAQLNTVEGINRLATKLDSLLGDTNVAQSLQAAGLVGHTVMASGSTLDLAAGGQAAGGLDLAGAVDHLVVTIKDASGAVIHTSDLGRQDAGLMNFAWDGTNDAGVAAAAGRYTFSVDAKSGAAKVVANTLTAGVVSSVMPGTDGAQLLMSGGGSLALSQVKQIY